MNRKERKREALKLLVMAKRKEKGGDYLDACDLLWRAGIHLAVAIGKHHGWQERFKHNDAYYAKRVMERLQAQGQTGIDYIKEYKALGSMSRDIYAHHLSHGRLRKKVWEGQYFVTHLLYRDEIRAMR